LVLFIIHSLKTKKEDCEGREGTNVALARENKLLPKASIASRGKRRGTKKYSNRKNLGYEQEQT